MITLNIKSDREFIISGHALYDDFGKDIVCAAVSSIVTTTINGVISIDENAIIYNYEKEALTIKIKKQDLIINKLVNNMLDMIKELSNQYPNNIKINDRR